MHASRQHRFHSVQCRRLDCLFKKLDMFLSIFIKSKEVLFHSFHFRLILRTSTSDSLKIITLKGELCAFVGKHRISCFSLSSSFNWWSLYMIYSSFTSTFLAALVMCVYVWFCALSIVTECSNPQRRLHNQQWESIHNTDNHSISSIILVNVYIIPRSNTAFYPPMIAHFMLEFLYSVDPDHNIRAVGKCVG